MLETGNNTIYDSARLTIRISRNKLSFSVVDAQALNQLIYEPYTVRSGISTAANLREAFTKSELLTRGYKNVCISVDTHVLMIPLEEFVEEEKDTLYNHTFIGHENDIILHSILPELNSVAAFAINKDLKLVIEDHFSDIRFMPAMQHVWTHMHRKSFVGPHQKLYGYFHDKKVEVFCYNKNRFRYVNTFDVDNAQDSVYFLLYVWKLLSYDVERDEMHLVGDMPNREWIIETLHKYIKKAYVINPSAEFNRAPATQIKGLPYDLITYYTKMR